MNSAWISLRRAGLVSALAVLAACAEVPEAPPPAPVPVPATPPAVREAKVQPTLKYLPGRHLKPQPTRPLNVRSRCSHRDEAGTNTRLSLQVANAELKAFSARIEIPKHGQCRFESKDFTQTEKLPQVLLAARNGSGCTVRIWEQGPRVTIAFNQCKSACEGEAFDYLWPILVDAKTGRCF